MKTKKHRPEYFHNALAKPFGPHNYVFTDGFYYGYSCPAEKKIILFTKHICAN